MKSLFLLGVAVCLGASGCDSKNPLSDPQTAKADERLAGVWRERNGDADGYYHVGHAGEKFPAGMMRVVMIGHRKGNVEPPAEFLIFPTVIGDKSFLNVVAGRCDKLEASLPAAAVYGEQLKRLDKNGWTPDAVDGCGFLKYQFDSDKLLLYSINEEAKQKAIKIGKVKGVVKNSEKFLSSKFTDTTENVARFVAEAGESLWDTKPSLQLERVKMDK